MILPVPGPPSPEVFIFIALRPQKHFSCLPGVCPSHFRWLFFSCHLLLPSETLLVLIGFREISQAVADSPGGHWGKQGSWRRQQMLQKPGLEETHPPSWLFLHLFQSLGKHLALMGHCLANPPEADQSWQGPWKRQKSHLGVSGWEIQGGRKTALVLIEQYRTTTTT